MERLSTNIRPQFLPDAESIVSWRGLYLSEDFLNSKNQRILSRSWYFWPTGQIPPEILIAPKHPEHKKYTPSRSIIALEQSFEP